jgi:2',3'-cyclic-nucleotide 2'-phosphodiesterase (5'-nucleotidase family)
LIQGLYEEETSLRQHNPGMNILRTATALLLTLLMGCTALPDQAESRSGEVLIIYSGNALGELKPCGCDKEEDQGGIERRMGYLKQVKEPNTLLVDLGDNFKGSTRQGKLKAQTMMKALAQMNYDAITLGDKDLLYGNGFLSGISDIPWVAANLKLEKLSLPPARIKVLANGLKVFVTAVADPDLFYASSDSNVKLSDPLAALQQQIDNARKNESPDLVVVLTHMPRDKGMKFLDLPGIDVVINGHIENDTDLIDMAPVEKAGNIFVQPGPLGQKMGELRVHINPEGEKRFQQKMVRLGSKAPTDPEMTQLYGEYNAEVEELFMATLAAKRTQKQSRVYATDQTCLTCHAEEHALWSKTGHGRAYAELEEVNKSFDPECLTCHTTGFGKPGGFISEIDTPELKNVQCEMCHGARLEHSQNPQGGFAAEANAACSKCHVKKHSPKFNFGRYWPRIRH